MPEEKKRKIDAYLKTILFYGSPSAWVVQLHKALRFTPLFSLYFSFIFFFLCCYFFLKAGTLSQAIHHVWMCSDILSSQRLISQGKKVCVACLHFVPISVSHQNPPFSFPTHCKQDVCWGKQMLTHLLHLKRKEITCEHTNKRYPGKPLKF